MTAPRPVRLGFSIALAAGGLALAFACNEKRVAHVDRPASPPAKTEVQKAEERAAAAGQRLQEAQTRAGTDQEKEDAVRQYEAERQAIANGSDTSQSASGDSSSPPPQ